jgi:Ser/Thr protein kinase RdoA (MazF antagonist)
MQWFAGRLRERIEALPVSALERGVCHGDLQGYHAKAGVAGRLTFYDFDCGGYGFRAYDLAVFLWCCRLEEAVEARWLPFLQGYGQTRQISELDVEAVPLFVCARYLWHVGVHAQNAPEWGAGFLDDDYFDTHLGRLHTAANDYL